VNVTWEDVLWPSDVKDPTLLLKGVPVLVVVERIGMHVIGPTANTAEAVNLTADPLLAIVDINLKQETSCGLIDELHQQGVPVIVVSAYNLKARKHSRKNRSVGQI